MVEKNLWVEVEEENPNDDFEALAPLISKQSKTMVQVTVYDRLVEFFCITKVLMRHVLNE